MDSINLNVFIVNLYHCLNTLSKKNISEVQTSLYNTYNTTIFTLPKLHMNYSNHAMYNIKYFIVKICILYFNN